MDELKHKDYLVSEVGAPFLVCHSRAHLSQGVCELQLMRSVRPVKISKSCYWSFPFCWNLCPRI